MDDKELESLLEEIGADLERWQDESGGVFYSGRSALVKGDFYLMGLNPGGDPKTTKISIDESLKQWKGEKDPNWSAYKDENWVNDDNDKSKNGTARHQVRVRDFCENLLRKDFRTIFSANSLFVRTTKEIHLREKRPEEYEMLLADCWKVHQRILSIVRPKIIVCLGNGPNSSFLKLRDWLKVSPEYVKAQDFPNPKRGRNFYIRWFDKPTKSENKQEFNSFDFRVVGVPHPSWFDLRSEEFRGAWESLTTSPGWLLDCSFMKGYLP